MALITPFRVQRRTFLRDVGFFTVAVTLTLCILYDQHIHLWEALLMVGLYSVYVLFVAVGSWWENRQAEKKRRIREARGEYEDEDLDDIVDGDVEWEGTGTYEKGQCGFRGYVAEVSGTGQIALPTSGASTPRSEYPSSHPGSPASTLRNAFASPVMTPPYSPDVRDMARSQSQSSVTRGPQALRPPPTPLMHQHRRKRSRSVRPSLLGAIEFADVVHSLSSDQSNAANVLAVFGGGHQHHAHSHDVLEEATEHTSRPSSPAVGRRRAHSHAGTLQLEGGDETLANSVLRDAQRRADVAQRAPLGPRRTTWTGPDDSTDDEAGVGGSSVIDLSKGVDDPWKDARSPLPRTGHARTQSAATVPSIYLTTENGSATALDAATRSSSEATITPAAMKKDTRPHPSRRQLLHALLGALFPSLQAFTSKSLVGKITAVLCVPALLALNLTLPVAEEALCDDNCSWTEEKRLDPDAGERSDHADLDAVERIGRALHSPGTLHGHEHDASPTHRLQHLRAEAAEADAPSPSLAWGEVTRDPLEPLNLGSPAVALQQNPLEEFGVVQSPAAAEEASRQDLQSPVVAEQEGIAREHVTRTLTAMQCALGPVFVVTALFGEQTLYLHTAHPHS